MVDNSKWKVLACAFAFCPPGTIHFKGGEDTLGWNLVKQIARFHEVWVLTDADHRESVESGIRDEKSSNIHPCYVGMPAILKKLKNIQGGIQLYYFLWQIKVYFVAKKLHSKHNFDIFHHITYANDWMQSFTGAFLKIPYIRGPGGGSHRTPKGFQSEYPISGRIWEIMRTVGQKIFRADPIFIKGHNRAKRILVCIHESMAGMPNKWLDKTELFPVNGVSDQDLKRRNLDSFTPDCFRIISAGSLLRIKGFGLAIKSFAMFSKKYRNSELWIVGQGPELDRLTRLVSSVNLEGKVKFTGRLSREDLLDEICKSDVFLFPSLRDGGGAVVVEAMAQGKPTVCLDIGGPGMHIDSKCGVKIKPTSPDKAVKEIAEALETLYLNSDYSTELGYAAKGRATQFYHWDTLGDRLKSIYCQAIATSPGGDQL